MPQLTDVEDRHCELDVTKVTRTLLLALAACSAHLASIDGSEFWVVQASLARSMALLVHSLWILDMTDTHALDLFGREESKLDLLHRLERSARVGKGRHAGQISRPSRMKFGLPSLKSESSLYLRRHALSASCALLTRRFYLTRSLQMMLSSATRTPLSTHSAPR